MRVLMMTYGARGDGQPLARFAVRVCAPPDQEVAKLSADVGVPTGGWR